jgi:hypothetical protein
MNLARGGGGNSFIFSLIPRYISGFFVKNKMKHLNSLSKLIILILCFHRDVDKICALLGYYAASCGNCLPTFRDNVSVPSSRVKSPRRKESRHRNVDFTCEGASGEVISRRDDSL